MEGFKTIDHDAIRAWLSDCHKRKLFNFAAASRAAGMQSTFLRDYVVKGSPKHLPTAALDSIGTWLEQYYSRPTVWPKPSPVEAKFSPTARTDMQMIGEFTAEDHAAKRDAGRGTGKQFWIPNGLMSGEALEAIEVVDRAMEQTYPAGSYVFIDAKMTDPSADGDYVIARGGKPTIRRIRAILTEEGERYQISADDPDTPNQTIKSKSLPKVSGRIIGALRRV